MGEAGWTVVEDDAEGMIPRLPICLGVFTSTKGHFGRKTDWRLTLDHWDKQLPLAAFGERICHLKVTPGDEQLAAEMTAGLQSRGFHMVETVGNWQRGLSHGSAYLGDQIKVSQDPRVHTQPYFLLLEDDAPVLAHGCSLEDLLLRSCHLLATNHELVTVRTIRKGDYDGGVPSLGEAEEGRAFYSPHTDFQPLLIRSLDFYRLGMILEANPQACEQVQCEAMWAKILRQFSRSSQSNLVWKPFWAEAVHLGIPSPEHEQLCRQLNLS